MQGSTVRSHQRRTVADGTHRSFCPQWFPPRGREQANAMLASLDPSWWGFRVDASFCRPILEYRHVVGAEIDSPCVSEPVLPASSSPECPKFPGLRRGFSCQCFLSLVERQELCRYTSGSAVVARLGPCPICRPSSPARYALGVGERCAGWLAIPWRTIPTLRLRPHQQLSPSSSALPHGPIGPVLSREAPQGSLPAFASGDVVDGTDATDICSITEQPSLHP
jgi:hypothetical protein